MLKAEDAFMVLSRVAIAQASTTLWVLKRVGNQRVSNPLETSVLEIGRHTHAAPCWVQLSLGYQRLETNFERSPECTLQTCMLH